MVHPPFILLDEKSVVPLCRQIYKADKAIVEKVALAGIKKSFISAHSLTRWQRGGSTLSYTAINEKQVKRASGN